MKSVQAYSAIDPDGKGYITREDFMGSVLVKRIATKSVSLQDVLDYVVRDNLFKSSSSSDGSTKMDIDSF
jgi:hypothetical protein